MKCYINEINKYCGESNGENLVLAYNCYGIDKAREAWPTTLACCKSKNMLNLLELCLTLSSSFVL